MESERWQRIERILDELLDSSAEVRAARLAELGEEDPGLRAELERLLAADSAEGSGILDRGLGSMAGGLLGDEGEPFTPAGRLIGPYRVLDVLGRGGMGEVLLAERADGEFEHRVALKLVPAEGLREEYGLRLRQERQILARLRHPNIASLYDGGVTDDGAPFFAMEVVEGEAITSYSDRAGLPVADRLRLFDAVCHAVQFAHRNLVIHRDIKPSNVLVTGEGRVKLMDFGIAKLVDDGETTQAEQRFLTPVFASPEQLRGEPTSTATDIYALGLLLYELLTGRRPYGERTDSAAMMRAILEEEATRASEQSHSTMGGEDAVAIAERRACSPENLRRQLRGDLDTILEKALQKDPSDRYPSVEELRLDLQRFLVSEPVSARPATATYKLMKFVRRNRLGVALAGVALIAGFAFSLTVGWLWSRAESNLLRAREAEAASAREAATLREVTGFLTELFEVASPEHSQGRDITARELLDAGSARIAEDLDTEPSVRSSLQLTMSASYRWLGRYDEALDLAESALEHRRALYGEQSVEFADALREVGWLHYYLGDVKRAETTARQVIGILEAALPAEDPTLADPLSALGYSLLQQGRFAEAEPLLERVLAIRESEPTPDHEMLALASNDLAIVMMQTGRPDEAGDLFARAIEAHHAAGDSIHPSLGAYLTNLGEIRRRQERFEEAEQLMLDALAVTEAAYDEESTDLADRHNALGRLYDHQSRLDEAERHYLRALEILSRMVPEEHPEIALIKSNLAEVYIAAGRLEEAEPLCMESIELTARTLGEESVYHGLALFNMAELREVQGRWAEAGELHARGIALFESEFGPEHGSVALRLYWYARNRERLGLVAEAEVLYERALSIQVTEYGEEDPRSVATHEALAALRVDRQN